MSVYARRLGKPRPIYGISSKTSAANTCGCPVGLNALFANLVMMLEETKEVINTFFPVAKAFAPIIADMKVEVTMPPFIFVRLVWADQHKGVAFNKTKYKHIIDLIDLYYQFKFDPKTDPLPLYDLLAKATAMIQPDTRDV
jgi:hypothetical protein